jgi:predicted PurR-regulated permease PerM
MKRTRLSLGAKLFGISGVLCALMLVVVLVAISNLAKISGNGDKGLHRSNPRAGRAE